MVFTMISELNAKKRQIQQNFDAYNANILTLVKIKMEYNQLDK